MHEFSIVEGLLGIIKETAQQHSLSRIDVVKLKIGAMRQAVPEAIQFAFEALAEGTVAQGAKIIIDQVPLSVRCDDCSTEFPVVDHAFFCTSCGSRQVSVITGKELYIDSIEGE